MRKIHHYQTIRYFPHLLSDEFVNIGIILNASEKISRLLSIEEAKHLYCSVLIGDKKKFLGVVEYLNKLSDENRLLESIICIIFASVKSEASHHKRVNKRSLTNSLMTISDINYRQKKNRI